MRTKYNGFVKFMCKLDGKEFKPVREFQYKEPWPGDLRPSSFITLVERVCTNYSVGDILEFEDRMLLDRAITWDSVCIEFELSNMYDRQPIPILVMECFQNWHWRIRNGEEPQEINDDEEDEGDFDLPEGFGETW